MYRRILAVVLAVCSLVLLMAPASYAGTTVPHSAGLDLSAWPTILAGLCGLGSAQLTAILTHRKAPQWIKSGVALALSTLAGVLITVTTVAGYTWKDYASEIAVAWLVAMGSHYAGLTALASNITAGSGVGAGVAPIVQASDPAPTGGGAS